MLTRASIAQAEREIEAEIEAEEGSEDERMDRWMALTDFERDAEEARVLAEHTRRTHAASLRRALMSPHRRWRHDLSEALRGCLRARMHRDRMCALSAPRVLVDVSTERLRRYQRRLLELRQQRAGDEA